MAKPFTLQVVSPEAIVWSGEAEMLVTRTTEGEIGILADHEPTMASLATGSTVIHAAGGETITIAIHGGFLQIDADGVTLLTDRAVLAGDGVEQARQMAEEMAAEEEPV
jgi:F-type H+-transporting ATPase subunit epsilon